MSYDDFNASVNRLKNKHTPVVGVDWQYVTLVVMYCILGVLLLAVALMPIGGE